MTKSKILMLLASISIITAISAGTCVGYFRNEQRCYDLLYNELKSEGKLLFEWRLHPPEDLPFNEMELRRFSTQLLEAEQTLLRIKSSQHLNVCDFYIYGFSIEKK